MNGRIYDPTLGRFLQADPLIQAPTNSQSYNRYAYVFNNLLKYTDPSGYSAWTKFVVYFLIILYTLWFIKTSNVRRRINKSFYLDCLQGMFAIDFYKKGQLASQLFNTAIITNIHLLASMPALSSLQVSSFTKDFSNQALMDSSQTTVSYSAEKNLCGVNNDCSNQKMALFPKTRLLVTRRVKPMDSLLMIDSYVVSSLRRAA
jgi:hypothetical protein